jgi:hypothetical protein
MTIIICVVIALSWTAMFMAGRQFPNRWAAEEIRQHERDDLAELAVVAGAGACLFPAGQPRPEPPLEPIPPFRPADQAQDEQPDWDAVYAPRIYPELAAGDSHAEGWRDYSADRAATAREADAAETVRESRPIPAVRLWDWREMPWLEQQLLLGWDWSVRMYREIESWYPAICRPEGAPDG